MMLPVPLVLSKELKGEVLDHYFLILILNHLEISIDFVLQVQWGKAN